ncbi:MAG: Rpp14/Pop5 family protein [Nanoarchaeota archaeon]|nr:Rpp14/Pop5 family protein [Nanoarchaeota archaeon]
MQIKASQRENQRYLVYDIISEQSLPTAAITTTIQTTIQDYFGIQGLAKANIHYLINEGKRGIIQTNAKNVNELRTALTFVKHINQQSVIVRTINVSGMYKKAETAMKNILTKEE